MFSFHSSELISCGCRSENLPALPVPELPDSTESTDSLDEAVSKFFGIEVCVHNLYIVHCVFLYIHSGAFVPDDKNISLVIFSTGSIPPVGMCTCIIICPLMYEMGIRVTSNKI